MDADSSAVLHSEVEAIAAVLKEASVAIHRLIGDHAIVSDASADAKVNESGDKVLALDELSDIAVEDALKGCDLVAGFASEERKSFVPLSATGKYIVVFDPLDGSQNVPVGISVGTIYGIFAARSLTDIKGGSDMVGACYALHSSCLVWCFAGPGKRKVEFAQHIGGAWRMLLPDHKIPHKGKTYCINEASTANWDAIVSDFVVRIKPGRSIRWMCCMVADVHRPLMQGGAFLYPADKKYPNGRLRLVYEAYCLAYIWEAAGGKALATVTGERVLDRPFPHDDVHQRVGVIFLGPFEAGVFEESVASCQQN